MQTSPVLNQANPLSNPAPTHKSSAPDGSVTPFDQMLSRQIAGRDDAAETSQKSQTAQADGASSAKPIDGNAKAKDAKPARDGKSDDDKKSGDKDDTTQAAAQTPADMLALVANLKQAGADAKNATAGDADSALSLDAKAAGPAAGRLAGADRKGGKKTDAADVAADALNGKDSAGKAGPATAKAAGAHGTSDAVKAATDLAAKDRQEIEGAASAKADFTSDLKASMANTPIAPPSLQALQHAAAPVQAATEKLAPSVGSPGWDQALGQKVVWMVAGGQQSASLTLNPPDLGPLQVVLNVDNSTAHATFTAAQPEVRQALEAALPKLRDMLGNAGIQLGQATVNSGAQNQQQAPDRQFSQGARHAERIDSRGDASLRVGRVQAAVSGQGLVDTFV